MPGLAFTQGPTLRPPAGGSIFVEDARVPAPAARILWRAEHDPSVVAVAAEPVRSDSPDRFELASLAVPTTIVTLGDGSERVAISDGLRRIRLDVESGTLLEGPVRLHYRLAGIEDVEAKLATLRRLLSLSRLGRFSRAPDTRDSRRGEKLILTYLFHRLEERFDGRPTLLILDEAWIFLDHPLFAARIREWLKTLRKKNVAVVFATQSLADMGRPSGPDRGALGQQASVGLGRLPHGR